MPVKTTQSDSDENIHRFTIKGRDCYLSLHTLQVPGSVLLLL
jgi:hypothetical protein